MRAFDLLSRAEYDIRQSSQPRHQFEMALVKWIHLRQLTPLTDLIAGLEIGQRAGARVRRVRQLRRFAAASARLPVRGRRRRRPAPSRSRKPRRASQRRSRQPRRAGASGRRAAGAGQPPTQAAGSGSRAGGAATSSRRCWRRSAKQNKVFYSMVIAQAQKVEVEGDADRRSRSRRSTRRCRAQLEGQARVDRAAGAVGQRPQDDRASRARREPASPPPPIRATPTMRAPAPSCTARAKAEPTVQAVLDVFGGEIEDVEEIAN